MAPELVDGECIESDLEVICSREGSTRTADMLDAFLDELDENEDAVWKLTHDRDEQRYPAPIFNCMRVQSFVRRGYNVYRLRPLDVLKDFRILYAYDGRHERVYLLAIVRKRPQGNEFKDDDSYYGYEYAPPSLREFGQSTMTWGFPDSISPSTFPPTFTDAQSSAPVTPSKPDMPARRSARSSMRESRDPAYRERKHQARANLAAEIYGARLPQSLAEVRLACGFSQHDLAMLTGLTQPHIAKIEARKLRIYLATAQKIAAALSLSIEELATLVLPLTDKDESVVMESSDAFALLAER
jgi:DNA-binding XRE family transcriptional regulator